MPDGFSHGATSDGRFPSTHRSAVLAVGSDDPAERARAFEILVRAYWKPVYKHVRLRHRKVVDAAQELTQSFFARAFEKRYFRRYEPSQARFRTYLKACLDRFVMEDMRDARRQKRGGGAVHLSLDFEQAEGEMLAVARHGEMPDIEQSFDHEWVRTLFGAAVDGLRQMCAECGREKSFHLFQRYVLDDEVLDKPSYASLAAELSISVSDVTNYLAWARREFRRIVLEELRQVTSSEEEFRAEARAVLGIDP
jgi:RNA polymerase sigma factor (sigma-70 family)